MAFHNLRVFLALPTTLTVTNGGAATAAILCIFFPFFLILFLHKKRISATLPPGPPGWPILGNLHQLVLPAHRSLKGLADKYGPILFLRLGSVPVVVVSSSEKATEFLKTRDLIFASRPPKASGRLMFYNYKDVVFAPYGDHWRQVRKICVLELLTAKRIESFKSVREEEVSAMIHSIWEKSKNGRMGVNMSKAISTLSSNIVWRILASRKFSDNDLGGYFKGFKELLAELTATIGEFNIGDFFPYLDCLDLQGINRRMKKIHKTFDEFAEKIIDDHVNSNHLMGTASSNGQKEADAEPLVQDFVDVLLHKAVTVGGYYIPKKTTVMVNVWAIGRDPHVWGADASEFKPERFMGYEHINLTDQSDFSMIPFGAGRSGCPGASMAIPTIKLALAQLLHTFGWKVEGDPSELDMKEACGVTIPRQVPLCAYPTPRASFPL